MREKQKIFVLILLLYIFMDTNFVSIQSTHKSVINFESYTGTWSKKDNFLKLFIDCWFTFSFKSKRYRDKLRTEIKGLEGLIPIDRSSLHRKLDSQTVFRLIISFFRLKMFFKSKYNSFYYKFYLVCRWIILMV